MKAYPLEFQPIFHYRIWGGDRLQKVLGKSYDEDTVGESWEISAVPGSETKVLKGAYEGMSINELIEAFGADFLGTEVYQKYQGEFPLLIKFIDAKKPLSIQVHPSDELARERHNSFGKNEMWYIMPSYEDANITVGFKEAIDKKTYQEHLSNKSLTQVLNQVSVSEGDLFYIPTGRVHAIGNGVMLAEIQQSSDVTYRIYDYDRKDLRTGATRELHTDLALDAIDFSVPQNYKTDYSKEKNVANPMVESPYFKTNFWEVEGKVSRDLSDIASFVIYMCVKGSAQCLYQGTPYTIDQGRCLLLPQSIDNVVWQAEQAQLLEIYL